VPELGEATLLSILELILQLYLAVYVFLEIFMFTWACDYYPQYRWVGWAPAIAHVILNSCGAPRWQAPR
jgi:hypothetical protein